MCADLYYKYWVERCKVIYKLELLCENMISQIKAIKVSINIARSCKIKYCIEINLIEEDVNNGKKLVIWFRGV